MRENKIIVKKYSSTSLFIGISLLLLLISFVTYFILLGPIQQCASIEFCGSAEYHEFKFSWIRLIVTLVMIMGGLIILLKTNLLGGLNEKERIVIGYIYQHPDEKIIPFRVLNNLRINNVRFRKMDNNGIYRILNRLKKFGYIEDDKEKGKKLSAFGLSLIKEINN